MKRFYKIVSVQDIEGKFGIYLDAKPIKTPAGKSLLVDSPGLARALSAEWTAQEKEILPATMPVNQIVISSLDETRTRGEIEKHILDYIHTDLLAFQSAISPYREKQNFLWGKWIAWFEKHFDVKIKIIFEITPATQMLQVEQAVKIYISGLDEMDLILFESLVELTSSYILVSAFFEGQATPQDVFDSVFLEDMIRADIYDENKYGAAPDQIKKRETVRRDLDAAAILVNLRR